MRRWWLACQKHMTSEKLWSVLLSVWVMWHERYTPTIDIFVTWFGMCQNKWPVVSEKLKSPKMHLFDTFSDFDSLKTVLLSSSPYPSFFKETKPVLVQYTFLRKLFFDFPLNSHTRTVLPSFGCCVVNQLSPWRHTLTRLHDTSQSSGGHGTETRCTSTRHIYVARQQLAAR